MRMYQDYWKQASTSGQRYKDPSFLNLKAQEHIQIIRGPDDSLYETIVDLGCGFGEVLAADLNNGLDIQKAIDYSPRAVEKAKKLCQNFPISIVTSDALEYICQVDSQLIIACQSVNQYLDSESLKRLVASFSANPSCKRLILFDTICPLRYLATTIFPVYVRYDSNPFPLSMSGALLRSLRYSATLFVSCFGLAKYGSIQLSGPSMGFAYSPIFFRSIAKEMGLMVNLYSSRFYEYRFHVDIMKPVPESTS